MPAKERPDLATGASWVADRGDQAAVVIRSGIDSAW